MTQWCYYVHDGNQLSMVHMSKQNSNRIELSFASGIFDLEIDSNNTRYQINISNMQQTNISTGAMNTLHRNGHKNVDLWKISGQYVSGDTSSLLDISYYYWVTTRDIKYKEQIICNGGVLRGVVDFDTMRFQNCFIISPPINYNEKCINSMIYDNKDKSIDGKYSDNSSIPQDFYCPITSSLFIDPVICSDGHTYERFAICRWLSDHKTSPMTNKILNTTVLYSNHLLKKIMH